jgi:hypothetical protein
MTQHGKRGRDRSSDELWAEFERTGRESATVALPFVPFHLSTLLDNFLKAMSSTRDDLAYRTGAKVA